jgi:hypothetical protein
MRLLALAVTLLLADLAVASAQTATPDSDNGRYSFHPVADGVLRLDTRTGEISQCSRSDASWVCKVVPDERSALEMETPAERECDVEEASFGSWTTRTRCAGSVHRPARRSGAQAAERCGRGQGDFVS